MKPCKCSICTFRSMGRSDEELLQTHTASDLAGHTRWLAEQSAMPVAATKKVIAPVSGRSFTSPPISRGVRGCADCLRLGRRCAQCQHDS